MLQGWHVVKPLAAVPASGIAFLRSCQGGVTCLQHQFPVSTAFAATFLASPDLSGDSEYSVMLPC